MVASPIYTVLKCFCFFYQVLFHGESNAVSIVIDMKDWDKFDVI